MRKENMKKRSEEPVLSSVEGNVGHVLFNRPERSNAFDLHLAQRFLDVKVFRRNETVRVVVIRGAGKSFSAGGDVKEMMHDVTEGSNKAAFFLSPLTAFNRMVLSITRMPKPVLASVHGAVAGVAFSLMLACDLIVAMEKTVFTQAFIKIGLSPDGGGTYFLPRLIGHARACELTMLPTMIDTETALRWGLINWVVPACAFDDETRKVAERLARGSVAAIKRTKSLLNQTWKNSLGEQLEAEQTAQIENSADPSFAEGVRAFVQKREPRFADALET
jgi:2-(1,2-epoxy-1,2-dihydrophenyl)acetyl-CoA isomerase